MFSQQLIHALVADRERAVADLQRQRLVSRGRPVRWVRRPSKPVERR